MQVRSYALLPILVCLPVAAYAQSGSLVTIDAWHMVSDSTVTLRTIPLGGGSERFFSKCSAGCPAGYAVVGGGYSANSPQLTIRAEEPWESSGQGGWAVTVEHPAGINVGLRVYARCMRTSGGDTPPDPTPTGALLFDDFSNSTVPQWVGKNEGAHSGTVVTDPLDSGNKVLRLTDVVPAGDMFSPPITVTPGQEYALCFDYLGTPVYTGGFGNGGAIGIAAGTPGNHRWLAGTYKAGGIEQDLLVDDGTWQAVRVTFYPDIAGSSVSSLRIMLEDFTGVDGDVYFDNMKLVPATQGC